MGGDVERKLSRTTGLDRSVSPAPAGLPCVDAVQHAQSTRDDDSQCTWRAQFSGRVERREERLEQLRGARHGPPPSRHRTFDEDAAGAGQPDHIGRRHARELALDDLGREGAHDRDGLRVSQPHVRGG
jgi:hypothetical protein